MAVHSVSNLNFSPCDC